MREYCTLTGNISLLHYLKIGRCYCVRPFVRSFVRPSCLTCDCVPYPGNYKS